MPTTSPSAVTSGPPELPGFAAASNWIRLVRMRLPSASGTRASARRSRPADTDGPMPNGKPTATTSSPGRRPLVERSVAGIRSSGMRLRLQHREVVLGLRADHHRPRTPGRRENMTLIAFAPCTTCRLVRMMPVSTITTPVPLCTSPPEATSASGRVRQAAHMHHGRQDAFVGVGGGGYRVLLSRTLCTSASTCSRGHAGGRHELQDSTKRREVTATPAAIFRRRALRLRQGSRGCAGAASGAVPRGEPGTVRTCCRPPLFSWNARGILPPGFAAEDK